MKEQQEVEATAAPADDSAVSTVMRQIAALAASQMQADWTGMSVILKDIREDDVPVFGNVVAEMLAQCAHWDARALEDGGPFDAVDRPLRAAAIAITRGNFERARILARGRCTPSEAAWAMVKAWNASEGAADLALQRAQRACAQASRGVKFIQPAL